MTLKLPRPSLCLGCRPKHIFVLFSELRDVFKALLLQSVHTLVVVGPCGVCPYVWHADPVLSYIFCLYQYSPVVSARRPGSLFQEAASFSTCDESPMFADIEISLFFNDHDKLRNKRI